MENIKPDNTISARVFYIDVFRGITIALMLIVNNQGDWQHVYRIFRHASWHGFLGADIVFPFFLFIVGASIPLSLNAQLRKEIPKRTVALKIIRRTSILIAIGLVINLLPCFDIATARIPGVLQRIGLCYGAAGLMYLYLKPRNRWIVAITILMLYTTALLFIGPEGFGIHPLLPGSTICFMIDRALLAGHTYAHAPVAGFDPEGIASTFPAIVSAMAGFFVTEYTGCKTDERLEKQKIYRTQLFAASFVPIVAGIAISPIMPINKNLWTPSYVLLTAGIASSLFILLKKLDDQGRITRWFKPLQWLGTNALFIYIASSAVGKILATTTISSQTGPLTIKAHIFTTLFSSWLPPYLASCAYALTFLIMWVACAGFLYRRGIFVKV